MSLVKAFDNYTANLPEFIKIIIQLIKLLFDSINSSVNSLEFLKWIHTLIIPIFCLFTHVKEVHKSKLYGVPVFYFGLNWKKFILDIIMFSSNVIVLFLSFFTIQLLFSNRNEYTYDIIFLRIFFIMLNTVFSLLIFFVLFYNGKSKIFKFIIALFFIVWIIYVFLISFNYINSDGKFSKDIKYEIYNAVLFLQLIYLSVLLHKLKYYDAFEIISSNSSGKKFVIICHYNGKFILRKIIDFKLGYYIFDKNDQYLITSCIDNFKVVNSEAKIKSLDRFYNYNR